jgi:NhaP-type Na+/H+ or K+/H+ antiporter
MKKRNTELLMKFGFVLEIGIFIITGILLERKEYLLSLFSYFLGILMAALVGRLIEIWAVERYCARRLKSFTKGTLSEQKNN